MNFGRLQPTYVSLVVVNNQDGQDNNPYSVNTSATSTINAEVTQYFNSPLFNNADDYVVAVERMEISTNGIPFYISQNEFIIVRRIADNSTSENIVAQTCYSLTELLTYLSGIDFVDPTDLSTFNILFTMTKESRVKMTLGGGKLFDNLHIEFPRILNLILGMSTSAQTTGSDSISSFPRFDLGDNFQHIVLESNLQTISDSVGQAPFQILTDFAPPTTYSTSDAFDGTGAIVKSGISVNIRQKLIYNPFEKRYLDMISKFNIQQINIKAYYVDLDNNYSLIPLPLGGVFSIKLGFYRKQ